MVQSRMLPPWPPLWPLYVWSLIYSCRDGEIFMETTNITCVNERIWLRVTSNTAKSATHTQPTTIWWKFLHLKSIADAHRQPILPKELALQWPAFFHFCVCTKCSKVLHVCSTITTLVNIERNAYFPTALPGRKRMKIKKLWNLHWENTSFFICTLSVPLKWKIKPKQKWKMYTATASSYGAVQIWVRSNKLTGEEELKKKI